MGTTKQHGGKREGSGRKKSNNTVVIRIPVEILSDVTRLIAIHKTKQQAKQQSECGCTVIGYTATGKEIRRVCVKHR